MKNNYSLRYFIENWLYIIQPDGSQKKLTLTDFDKEYLDIIEASDKLNVPPFLPFKTRIGGSFMVNPEIVKYLKSNKNGKPIK